MEADGVADTHQEHSTRELNDHLMRLLVDSKKWQDFPQAFQIMTCIVRMDKKVPGVRKSYDSLSEIVHPNWGGVFGLYSRPTAIRDLFRARAEENGSHEEHDRARNARIGQRCPHSWRENVGMKRRLGRGINRSGR